MPRPPLLIAVVAVFAPVTECRMPNAERRIMIGIDALAWVPGRQAGVETYLRQLVAALQEVDNINEYVIFVSREGRRRLWLGAANFREVVCPISSQCRPLRVLWEEALLARRARAEGVEVMLCVGGLVPRNLAIPAVQVIHDLQVFHCPEHFPWTKHRFLRWMLPRSAQAAQFTVASSEHTCADVIRFLGQPREKTRVVLLAAGPEFQPATDEAIVLVRRRYHIDGDYLLCVGTGHRHKNLPALLEAFRQCASARNYRHKLVWVGMAGRGLRARDWQSEDVKVLGRVPSEHLPPLYSGATAFVLPSLFEGFGMTVLEAMQCGCPVACSNLTALPEVAGDAALLFDPNDARQFQQTLKRVIEDRKLHESLRARGFAQARQFSWLGTAQQALAVLKGAAESMRRSW